VSEVFCAIACKAASCSPAEARVGRLLAGLLDSALGTRRGRASRARRDGPRAQSIPTWITVRPSHARARRAESWRKGPA
jgi:hypothetical protein